MQRCRPLIVVVAIAFAGCADNGDEGFVVINNSASAMCSFSGERDQPFLAAGSLSLFSPTGYVLAPLMESRITATTVDQQIQRTIQIRGARIDLTIQGANIVDATGGFRNITPSLSPELTHFKQLVSGSLPPAGTANTIFEVVPAAVLPQLRQQFPLNPGDRLHVIVTANVELFGEMGGDEITAQPFVYPVEICNDCNANVIGKCTMNMPPAVNVTGNACNPFQDGTIDCCLGDTNQLICPI